MSNFLRGVLMEYTLSDIPKILQFEFNPETVSYSYGASVPDYGSEYSGYGFHERSKADYASQGVEKNIETMSLRILIDAVDRASTGNVIADYLGIQPELDTLRSLVEPHAVGQSGSQTLNSLGANKHCALYCKKTMPVCLFWWGIRLLPVFITQVNIEVKEHTNYLIPQRAEADISLTIIEDNPFYDVETLRRNVLSVLNTGTSTIGITTNLMEIFGE